MCVRMRNRERGVLLLVQDYMFLNHSMNMFVFRNKRVMLYICMCVCVWGVSLLLLTSIAIRACTHTCLYHDYVIHLNPNSHNTLLEIHLMKPCADDRFTAFVVTSVTAIRNKKSCCCLVFINADLWEWRTDRGEQRCRLINLAVVRIMKYVFVFSHCLKFILVGVEYTSLVII